MFLNNPKKVMKLRSHRITAIPAMLFRPAHGLGVARGRVSVWTAVLIRVALLFTGCSRYSSPAEAFLADYYDRIEHAEFDRAAGMYAAEFYRNRNVEPEAWQTELRNTHQQLGALRSWNLLSWTEQQQQGGGREGQYFLLNFRVRYTDNEADESFIVFHPAGTVEDSLLILNWNFNPKQPLPSD